jgi:hypothetical protein
LDRGAEALFVSILSTLLKVEPKKDERGERHPHILQLAPKALSVLYQFEAEVERDLGDGGRYAGVRDWAGKMVGQSVRLAALLELAARAGEGRALFNEAIGAQAMDSAVRLVQAYATHALAVLSILSMDSRVELLRYVLQRVQSLPDERTLRDLHRATGGKAAIECLEDLEPLVEDLVDRGCLRLIQPPASGPGRPSSPFIEIHPLLRKNIDKIDTIPPEPPQAITATSHQKHRQNRHNSDQPERPPSADLWEGGPEGPPPADLRTGGEDEYERLEREAIEQESGEPHDSLNPAWQGEAKEAT